MSLVRIDLDELSSAVVGRMPSVSGEEALLSLEEAFDLGRRTNRARYGAAL